MTEGFKERLKTAYQQEGIKGASKEVWALVRRRRSPEDGASDGGLKEVAAKAVVAGAQIPGRVNRYTEAQKAKLGEVFKPVVTKLADLLDKLDPVINFPARHQTIGKYAPLSLSATAQFLKRAREHEAFYAIDPSIYNLFTLIGAIAYVYSALNIVASDKEGKKSSQESIKALAYPLIAIFGSDLTYRSIVGLNWDENWANLLTSLSIVLPRQVWSLIMDALRWRTGVLAAHRAKTGVATSATQEAPPQFDLKADQQDFRMNGDFE